MGIIERKRFRMTCRFSFAIMLYPFCKHRKKFRLYRNISTTSRSRWSNGSRKGYTLKGVAEERGSGHTTREKKPHPEYSGWGQFLEGAYMALLIPMRMSHQFMGYAVMKPQTMLICIMSQKTG